MKHQPSTPAHHLTVESPDSLARQNGVRKSSTAISTIDTPRLYFTRTALFSALTTSLVGFGCSIAPAAFAATADVNNSNINNSQTMIKKAATSASEMPNTSSVSTVQPSISNDSQTDMALDALRLKKAVEQGIIDQSVLDDYSEQTLGIRNLTR